jgi:PAS domain S-box-containing protein
MKTIKNESKILLSFFQKNQSQTLDEFIEGVQVLDQDLNYLYINQAAEKQNLRPKEELIGRNYVEAWSGIEKTKVFSIINQCLQNQTSHEFENKFEYPDGKMGWFLLRIQPVSEGVLILSLDITELKNSDQILQENENFYHSVFENLLNGFAYCEMIYQDGKPVDFTYLTVNKSFENLTGLKNAVGKKVSDLIPGIQQSDPQLFEIYGRVAATGKPETFEVFLDALKMWFFVTVYCPKIGNFVAIFDVITDRKNAEFKMKEQIDELQRWYSATIDREERSIELKKEVNQLLIEAGRPPRYLEI